MKRMICYFLLCALVLACIAGCITQPPVSTPTDPSGSASLENPTSSQTTQPTSQAAQPQQTQPSGGDTQPQPTEPGFTVPDYELEPLPTVDRETVGPLVEYDPDRELYILTGKNDIIYVHKWSANSYGFRIYSKKPLDVNSISVKLPISGYYSVTVEQIELGGVQNVDAYHRMDESYYSSGTFTYPLYLAYKGKDFHKLAELKYKADQLRELANEYEDMFDRGRIDYETYLTLCEPYHTAYAQYQDYLNVEWEEYLALTKEDLPQFYAYRVIISFKDIHNLGSKWEKEESFTQIEVTIGDKTYVQDVGKITIMQDWELPAQTDWAAGFTGIAGTLGSINGPRLYNDGLHCLEILYHYTADRYELLEELVLQNPSQTVERVWLRIRPKGGSTIVVEWDMSEPYDIYPGDDVTVYAAYRDENLNTLRYQTVVAAYLLCSSDGESYCRKAYCDTVAEGSDYLWYAIIFDGIDLESYYWDYYYLLNEPWRYDPEAAPVSPD